MNIILPKNALEDFFIFRYLGLFSQIEKGRSIFFWRYIIFYLREQIRISKDAKIFIFSQVVRQQIYVDPLIPRSVFYFSFNMIQFLPLFPPHNIPSQRRWGEKVRGKRAIKLYENKNEMLSSNWHVRTEHMGEKHLMLLIQYQFLTWSTAKLHCLLLMKNQYIIDQGFF